MTKLSLFAILRTRLKTPMQHAIHVQDRSYRTLMKDRFYPHGKAAKYSAITRLNNCEKLHLKSKEVHLLYTK